jgi:3-oxoacyl-[acyl-carrier protein] reductase
MKVALVTGASRGIGRACAVKLAAMGYYVIINFQSNEAEALNTLKMVREAGSEGEILKFDVSDAAEVDKAIEDWQDAHSGEFIECLVNNAGIRRDNVLVMMSNEEWDKVMNTNLNGFMYITRSVLRKMARKKRGRIINMVSLSGQMGLPGQTNYSAAKGAVMSATKALAQEMASRNITVNAVAPGYVRTDMTSDLNEDELKQGVPMKRFGEPEEIAAAVGFLASDEASYITGQIIGVNGGLYT